MESAELNIPDALKESLKILYKSYNPQLLTNNGIIVYANPALCKMLGAKTAEELVGKNMGGFVHPEDLAAVQEKITTITEDQFEFTTRLVGLDGNVIYVTECLTRLENGLRLTEIRNDTAHTLRMNAALLKERLAYELSIQNDPGNIVNMALPLIVQIAQADAGVILLKDSPDVAYEVEPSIVEILQSSDTLVSRVFSNEPTYADGTTELAEKYDISKYFKGLHLTAILPIKSNSTGVIGGILILSKDRPALHENAILDLAGVPTHLGEVIARARSEERYRQLFENIATGIVEGRLILDGNNQIVDYALSQANLYVQNKTGRDLTDLLEVPIGETPLKGEDGNRPVLEMLKAVYNGGQPHSVEVFQKYLGIWIRVNLLSRSGNEFVLTVEDITGERKLEELYLMQAIIKIREDLLRLVVHDLKGPLATFKLSVQTALKYIADSGYGQQTIIQRAISSLNSAVRVTDRMTRMVNHILEYTRLESVSKLELRPTEFIDYIENLFRTELEGLTEVKNQEITFVNLVKSNVQVRLNSDEFTRVITNLVNNAISYTPEGGTITVRVEVDETNVFLTVEDTGIGMSGETKERIFEAFYRSDESLDFESGHAGLGLATVRKICDLHNAKIEVESELGKGSKFKVIIPRV